MAIVRHYHKPDLFITMTCNPNWPEIINNLKPGETAENRPDLVARVFQLKKKQFLDDIIKGKIFGESIAHLWVIEHQKRGLPHIHILIILADKRKTMFAREVDKLTCAELPPSPHELGITEEDKKTADTMGYYCHKHDSWTMWERFPNHC